MNANQVKLIESDKFNNQGLKSSPLKRDKNHSSKYPTCHWCHSTEIRLVPVNFLRNLKPSEAPYYQKLWQRQGWPTNRWLCWVCRQNCELAYQRLNLWLCPKCLKCWVYHWDYQAEMLTYEQLPTNCFKCGWRKKSLSKREQKKIADQVIKSGLVYQKKQKTYLAQCNFCEKAIEGQHKNKLVKNRNQVRFWTDKVSEERLVCNGCVRGNKEFLELVAKKNQGRWRVYKSKGVV